MLHQRPAGFQEVYRVISFAKLALITCPPRLLREPLARVLSWYAHGYEACKSQFRHHRRFDNKTLNLWKCNVASLDSDYHDTFHQYFIEGRINLVDNFYSEQLMRWLSVVSRSQILILNMQTLISNSSDTMIRISSFLNVSHLKWSQEISRIPKIRRVLSSHHRIECSDYWELYKIFATQMNKLYELLLRTADERPVQEPDFPPFIPKSCPLSLTRS